MKKLTALVLALCMALGLAACGGSKDTGSAAGSNAAASGDTVKIGVYEPQSGDNGAGGKQEILGIQYANSVAPTVEIGGKTYNVKLEIVDLSLIHISNEKQKRREEKKEKKDY